MVFTPEQGGVFEDDGLSVTADPGAVPNGSIIGICAENLGPASNFDVSTDRYTAMGDLYRTTAVDASGNVLTDYTFNRFVEVCIPLPDALRANFVKASVISTDSGGKPISQGGNLRLGLHRISVCANFTSLPTSIAAGMPASQTSIPVLITPTTLPPLPDSGGAAPQSTNALTWLLLLGIALIGIAFSVAIGRRRTLDDGQR